MPSKITPLGPRMLVQPDETPQSIRGIALPERLVRRPEAGVITAVSDDLVGEFHVGDRVAFAPYSGIELAVDGKTVMVLSRSEVLGVYAAEVVDAAAT